MDEEMIGLPATGKPGMRESRSRPAVAAVDGALQRLEQQALQELALARPLPDAIDGPVDALTACISWDLESSPG